MATQPAGPHPSPGPRYPVARTRPGQWVLLVIGVLLALPGLWVTIAGAFVLGAGAAQHDGNYLTGDTERRQTTGYALTSPSVVIGTVDREVPGAPSLGDLASVRVRVSPLVPGQEVFVGVGEASDVSRYLQDVPKASLGNVSWSWGWGRAGRPSWSPGSGQDVQQSGGGRVPEPPKGQDFWAASASGPGTQELTFALREGQWSLVVMNADASRPVWVDIQAGARSELIGPVGAGILIGGLAGLVIGIPLLLLGAAGLGRDIERPMPAPRVGPGAASAGRAPGAGSGKAGGVSPVYPVRFVGFLDRPLSRGLWLVKWLLAIPHLVVLLLLWFALAVTTIAAGFAILFTGRYPRPWFAFSVGVLRWSWRVGFYAYAALGTDRYPPFTLARADYPAEFDVAYPERLSRGLVLVKWWLLAIPHWLVVSALTDSGGGRWFGVPSDGGGGTGDGGPSLLGVLVLIAAVILLFTGRYREEIFSFVVGINRWLYRVGAYVLLMRDEYPPFRLDQGPLDPPGETPSPVETAGHGPASPPVPPPPPRAS